MTLSDSIGIAGMVACSPSWAPAVFPGAGTAHGALKRQHVPENLLGRTWKKCIIWGEEPVS